MLSQPNPRASKARLGYLLWAESVSSTNPMGRIGQSTPDPGVLHEDSSLDFSKKQAEH
jgi:hypothetical protein